MVGCKQSKAGEAQVSAFLNSGNLCLTATIMHLNTYLQQSRSSDAAEEDGLYR